MPTKQLYEVVDASIELPDVSGTYPVQYGSCRIPNDSCYFNKADNYWNFTFGQKVKFWLRPFDLSAHDREVEGKAFVPTINHLSYSYTDLLLILKAINVSTVVNVVNLIIPKKQVEADYLHSLKTKIRISERNAYDNLLRLLREGVLVNFLNDPVECMTVVQKVSPPLYDRYYRQTKEQYLNKQP